MPDMRAILRLASDHLDPRINAPLPLDAALAAVDDEVSRR
jgi:hypothetical protein